MEKCLQAFLLIPDRSTQTPAVVVSAPADSQSQAGSIAIRYTLFNMNRGLNPEFASMNVMGSLRKSAALGRLWAASGLLAISSSLLSAQSRPVLEDHYGQLPLSFEANRGQTDPSVRFLSRGDGYSLFLTDSEAVLSLRNTKPDNGETDVVRMQFVGLHRNLRVTGLGQLPGKANYFIGNDPAKWHRDVPTYSQVSYKNVYPGVDLVYYGNLRRLEYDFVIAPGADPKQVRLHFAGVRKVKLDTDGGLLIVAKNGEIAFHKPLVYQEHDGHRAPVPGAFTVIAKDTVGFALGHFNPTEAIVIDPTLAYSTYLGGSAADVSTGIAVNSLGETYMVGYTQSSDFPTTGNSFKPVGSARPGLSNAFVTKLNSAGTGLVYSTFLSGTKYSGSTCVPAGAGDVAAAISIDAGGNAYVDGCTSALDFPHTSGAYQISLIEKTGFNDAFVTKLSPDGASLIYSTYLGAGGDAAHAIAVDIGGDAYVAGTTTSSEFPTTPGSFQTVNHGLNAFVTKLNPSGTALVYSTLLGGSAGVSIGGIAVDSGGNAYVTGSVGGNDFPITAGAFQTVNKERTATGVTAFVTKLNANGTALLYSTYLGGSGGDGINDFAYGIAVDSFGFAYLTGAAGSADFPSTVGAYQRNNMTSSTSGVNVFVTKFNLTGTSLEYSTFLGGANADYGFGIAVDNVGSVYVTGQVSSVKFPVTPDAFQINNPQGAAFVAKFDPTGSTLMYSSLLGGTSGHGNTSGRSIAVDPFGNAYLAGVTQATDFPFTPGAFQRVNKTALPNGADGGTAFVAKFELRRRVVNDFDGDGKTDLTVFRPSNATWYVRYSSLSYSTAGAGAFQWGLPGDIPIASDFDGDHKTDLTVFRPSNATWYIRYSSLGYSTASAGAFQWGLPGDIPIAGDFDGDGKTDLTVFRPSNATWYIRYSSLGYSTASAGAFQWGLPADMPLTGDFDGDGKTDLAVFRPSTGSWYILYSSLGYATASAGAFQWGLPGDIPITGDFDGDGKTDIAVFRPSTGTWYIRYSSLGYSIASSNFYQWGLPGDVPIAADFDGDGKTELTVFRPLTDEWLIRYSSLGYSVSSYGYYQWGLPGDALVK
jgi:hypothetical protein